ncbi:MAG: YpsA SLOG family protein [Coriobacteriales bacterium]
MKRISYIRNAGQTGVERAALDAARANDIAIAGWCARGGVTADFPEAPGILARFPELRETPSRSVAPCLDHNTRDAHATLVIAPIGAPVAPLRQVIEAAEFYERRILFVSGSDDKNAIRDWVFHLGYGITLHVTGSTEEQFPGAYKAARDLIALVLSLS